MRPRHRSALVFALLSAVGAAQGDWYIAATPSPRFDSPLAYDSVRGRIVMFGGFPGVNDTWETDPLGWHRRRPPVSPPSRYGHVLFFDSIRRQTILFGGFAPGGPVFNDTWAWDGATWTQLSPATSPPARYAAAACFDPDQGIGLLFGGTASGSYLSDLWLWNGTTWTQRTNLIPSGRAGHTLSYDSVRRRVVLFGGIDGNGVKDEVVEWTGAGWAFPTPASRPPARQRHGQVFDPVRGETLVLFGLNGATLYNDGWVWNGTAWTSRPYAFLIVPPAARAGPGLAWVTGQGAFFFGGQVGTTALNDNGLVFNQSSSLGHNSLLVPAPRRGAALAFDSLRGRSVLVGGYLGPSTTDPGVRTWDGDHWTNVLPLGAPVRLYHDLVFDRARGRLVLFGGVDQVGNASRETHEWDGITFAVWTQMSPPARPTARQSHAMAYDAARGRTVLFGGVDPVNGLMSDTWLWDGVTWTQAATLLSPVARYGHRMVYDSVRQRIVLFGGYRFGFLGNFFTNDTWEWDGATWTVRTVATPPPPRGWHAMAYDEWRQRVVLFGGEDGTAQFLGDTWEYDGTDWRQRAVTTAPYVRRGAAMAFDSGRGRCVLHGGESVGPVLMGDTFEFGPYCDTAGLGHPGGGGTCACSSVGARLGMTWCVDLGPSPQFLSYVLIRLGPCLTTPIPLAPPTTCAPGSLFAIPDLLIASISDPAGMCLPIPNDLSLSWARLCTQGLVLQTGGCFRMSDALSVVVQRW